MGKIDITDDSKPFSGLDLERSDFKDFQKNQDKIAREIGKMRFADPNKGDVGRASRGLEFVENNENGQKMKMIFHVSDGKNLDNSISQSFVRDLRVISVGAQGKNDNEIIRALKI